MYWSRNIIILTKEKQAVSVYLCVDIQLFLRGSATGNSHTDSINGHGKKKQKSHLTD